MGLGVVNRKLNYCIPDLLITPPRKLVSQLNRLLTSLVIIAGINLGDDHSFFFLVKLSFPSAVTFFLGPGVGRGSRAMYLLACDIQIWDSQLQWLLITWK